jgi:hypothetical protein
MKFFLFSALIVARFTSLWNATISLLKEVEVECAEVEKMIVLLPVIFEQL